MAKSASAAEKEDTIRDIYDHVQESGTTRAAMQEALDQIASLCTDALPDLGEEDTDEEDADEDE